MDEPDLQALVTSPGLSGAVVMLQGDKDQTWKTAGDYGIFPVRAVEVTRPTTPPPAAPLPAAVPSAELAVQQTRLPVPAPAPAAAPPQLPTLIDSADEAEKFLTLYGAPAETSLAEVVGSVDRGTGGMSHSLPFSQLKEEFWDTRIEDKVVADSMPLANRPWTGILLAYRIGAVGWIGAGGKGKSGTPPAYRFVLPNLRVAPEALELSRRVLAIARDVQFTKAPDRVKYDHLGRLTAEMQILCWHPVAKACILVVPGYRSTTETSERLVTAEQKNWVRQPCVFTIETAEEVNKRVAKEDPSAKNASWTETYTQPVVDSTPAGLEMRQAFEAEIGRDRVAFANLLRNFFTGSDFTGLALAEVKALLDKYEQIPKTPRPERK
jgi:hypothetical protein